MYLTIISHLPRKYGYVSDLILKWHSWSYQPFMNINILHMTLTDFSVFSLWKRLKQTFGGGILWYDNGSIFIYFVPTVIYECLSMRVKQKGNKFSLWVIWRLLKWEEKNLNKHITSPTNLVCIEKRKKRGITTWTWHLAPFSRIYCCT